MQEAIKADRPPYNRRPGRRRVEEHRSNTKVVLADLSKLHGQNAGIINVAVLRSRTVVRWARFVKVMKESLFSVQGFKGEPGLYTIECQSWERLFPYFPPLVLTLPLVPMPGNAYCSYNVF